MSADARDGRAQFTGRDGLAQSRQVVPIHGMTNRGGEVCGVAASVTDS